MKPKADKHHPKRPDAIAVRVGPELYARYDEAAKRLHVSKSMLAEEAVRVVVEMVEKHGPVWPLNLVPSKVLTPNPELSVATKSDVKGDDKAQRAAP